MSSTIKSAKIEVSSLSNDEPTEKDFSTKICCKSVENYEFVSKEVQKKDCKIWQRKSQRLCTFYENKSDPSERRDPRLIEDVDFCNPDNRANNNHVIMDFSEVFLGPKTSHSFKCTCFTANQIYSVTSTTVYKILTALISIPFAIFFGTLFAVFAAISVFLCTPFVMLASMPLNGFSKV
ncbi:unnamed protein product [Thelazia callipaeda]|uniref:Caveolin n=1 Tax=Thelazia callipaeda TaxID=103827 RepID=A0A0N5CMB3_THECL|nr:unnamed protein product [Thelazia callipaeda]